MMVPGKSKKSEFQVTQTAAAKKPRATRKPKAEPEPIVVKQVHPAAMSAARMLARNRDVRIEVQRDGSVIIRNGAR